MYGFVNSALEKLIKRRFGEDKWEEIREHAKVILDEKDSFQVNHVYNDTDTYGLVASAAEVLGLDATTLLEMFGEQFLLWCQESGYAKTLQLLGRSLQDFLTNLDALHDHLSIIYPQMEAPSFRCTEGINKSEFLLHYYSERVGLEDIVMGIVKSVAREYYKVEVEVKLLAKKDSAHRGSTMVDHSIFSIREVGKHGSEDSLNNPETPLEVHYSDTQLVSSKTFCKAFPFHIIFDADMTVMQVGSSLSWLLPSVKGTGRKLKDMFMLERPRMRLTFENILSHINTIFILRMLPVVDNCSQQAGRGGGTTDDPMRLRGQMIYLPEVSSMLFLCSPRVKRLQDLELRGLYLSDIPVHDATRGLLMMGQAAEAEFINAVRLEELIIQLNATQTMLEKEKKRMSDLLHEMLPITVADRLMSGQVVESERYESVTILFSDVVGFTSICSKCQPLQIVSMLNKLYSMFDQVVGKNQVYKVETIGDAYMVVGGLPERSAVHADCVCNQALDMMHYCRQVRRPDNDEPIQMRVGINSGEVVAGIVGRKMPRFCLFGNTVNIASRTESNGVPGKIQVTEFTYRLLKDKPNFKFEYRGPLEFKNVPQPVPCHFLIENTEKEDFGPIVVAEDHSYEGFIVHPSTPPTPPPHNDLDLDALQKKLIDHQQKVSLPVPDIRVSHPTPIQTPHRSPQGSPRQTQSPPSLGGAIETIIEKGCPMSMGTLPEEDVGVAGEENMTPKRKTVATMVTSGRATPPQKDAQRQSECKVRISLSDPGVPVPHKSIHEAMGAQKPPRKPSEETHGISGEKRPSVGSDDFSATDIADASLCHSYDVDSWKPTDGGVDGVRKISSTSASSMEDEHEHPPRATRSGSVHERVQFFDSLGRIRRTGMVNTVITGGKPEHSSMALGSMTYEDAYVAPPLPLSLVADKSSTLPRITKMATRAEPDRPNRKSLDSQGSSGSGDPE